MKKLIALLLCLTMMLPFFVACKGDGDDEPKGPENLPEKVVEPLLVENLADYQIIYPEVGKSPSLTGEIRALRDAIKAKFGVTLNMKDDFVNDKNPIQAREILVGKTNRSESATVYAKAPRLNDYAIQIVDEKLVIAASSDEQMTKLLKDLTDTINALPEDATDFFTAQMQVLSLDEYDIDAVTINGEDLSAYTVVYAGNNETLAELFCERIEEKYQYKLTLSLEQTDHKPEKAIILGKTLFGLPEEVTGVGDDEYYIGTVDGSFYVYAVDGSVLYKAIEKVVSQKADSQTNTVALENLEVVEKPTATALISMSFNLWVSSVNNDRASHVVERINLVKPDTLGVQEASADWITRLKNALGAEYDYIGIGRDSGGKGEHSGIFYKKSTIKLIDGGTKWMSKTPDVVSKDWGSTCNRVFTYAVFERISDGKRFLHVNAHTEHTSDAICLNQLKVLVNFVNTNYADLPILLTGDLNATESEDSIKYVLNNGFDNGAKLAIKSSGGATFADRTIDFCLTSENDFIVFKYNVDTYKYSGDKDYQKENKDPSDHCPIYITYDFK